MRELAYEVLTAPASVALQALESASDNDLVALVESREDNVLDVVFTIADQRLANRLFRLVSPDVLRSLIQKSSPKPLGHLISLMQPTVLSTVLNQASNELVDKLVTCARTRSMRSQVIKALPPQRQAQWKKLLHEREDELQRIERDATEGQSSLLDERKRLLDEINAAIHAREQVLKSVEDESRIKQNHYEHLLSDAQARLSSLEEAITRRQALVDIREKELAAKLAEFEELNRRQVQQKIEAKVPEYVTAALKVLETREQHYRGKAAQWTVHGTLVLIAAIAATVALSLYGYGTTTTIQDMSWQALLFVSLKGLVVLGVLALWAKHAFTLSNAYMHEAIKRSDRAHAITFGKLYLEIYGNTVDRKELLDIFENWNITAESAFSKANPIGFEPQVLEKIGELIKLSERAKSGG